MKKTMIAIASLLLLSSICWSEDMEANANEVKYYDNAKVVRIKSVEGEGFVQRSYDEGNEEATANLPLFEKDTVGTTEGRLAVYLGRTNYLRLDADSIAVLEKIPQLRKTDLNVRLEQGSIYLDIESLDQEKGIEVQTPDCGIFLLSKGVYRVNSNREGRTEVIVLEGIAEVAGRENSSNVRENQMIVMEHGEMSERPFYFSTADKDDFDRWNDGQNREMGYARFGTSRYLQSGYEDYEYEMSRAGRWSYMSDFNSYAWTPYYANSDWRPYANGRWVWNPYYGYVWTSYDTCGWFTHHYGRWNWSYNQGWCWIPSYHWSPAWVSWFGNNDYYGWSPLSWWNRPIVIINNRWDRHYDYRHGIPHNSRSTIIIRKNELSAANIHRVALNRSTLGQNASGTISYRGTAPTDRPALNKVTVINAKGKSVTYKQSGIVSAEKYRAQGSDIHSTVYKYTQANGDEGTYRKKSIGGSAGEGSVSRARTIPSGSSAEKSSGKTSYRSRSDGAAKTSSSSSSSSSTSSSSSGTVKKKKGGVAYFSGTSVGNSSAGEAVASDSRYQSRYSSANSAIGRNAYKAQGTEYRSRSSLGEIATRSGVSGYNFNSSKSGDKNISYSAPSYNYRSGRSGAYESGSSSSYRSIIPSSSYSREYRTTSSSGSYSPSAGSRSTGSSGAYRSGSSSSGSFHHSSSSSGSSHGSSSSSSSSSSSRTAVKKK